MTHIVYVNEDQVFHNEQNRFLKNIEECDWFSKTGQECFSNVGRVHNWSEAIRAFSDIPEASHPNPIRIYNHRMTDYCSVLAAEKDQGKYDKEWNRLVTRANKSIVKYFKNIVFRHIPVKPAPPDLFLNGIMHFFKMELTLLSFCGSSFELLSFHNRLFLDGYCPCGYEGEFPEGRLIVF